MPQIPKQAIPFCMYAIAAWNGVSNEQLKSMRDKGIFLD
jgi:hypothetical protein